MTLVVQAKSSTDFKPTAIDFAIEETPQSQPDHAADTAKTEAFYQEEEQIRYFRTKDFCKQCLDRIDGIYEEKSAYTLQQLLQEKFISLFSAIQNKDEHDYHIFIKVMQILSQPEKTQGLNKDELSIFGDEAKLYSILLKQKEFYSLTIGQFVGDQSLASQSGISPKIVRELSDIYQGYLTLCFQTNSYLLEDAEEGVIDYFLKPSSQEGGPSVSLKMGIRKQMEYYQRNHNKILKALNQALSQICNQNTPFKVISRRFCGIFTICGKVFFYCNQSLKKIVKAPKVNSNIILKPVMSDIEV